MRERVGEGGVGAGVWGSRDFILPDCFSEHLLRGRPGSRHGGLRKDAAIESHLIWSVMRLPLIMVNLVAVTFTDYMNLFGGR